MPASVGTPLSAAAALQYALTRCVRLGPSPDCLRKVVWCGVVEDERNAGMELTQLALSISILTPIILTRGAG